MPRSLFIAAVVAILGLPGAAALAAAAAASSVSAQAQRARRAEEHRAIMDGGAEAHASENRPGGPEAAEACPEKPAPDDYLHIYCSANVRPQISEAGTPAPAPVAGCALPSEPWGIPAALDAAISGPADKDRACMKALMIPEARIIVASVGTDGAPSYTLETLDDWIARTRARGHATLEEKQLHFRVDRYGEAAHLWSLYALRSDGKAVARGINSIQAIKEASGWRVASIMVQAESASAPLPEEYQP